MDTQSLLDKVKQLNNQKKYRETILLLTKDELDQHKNSSLYTEISEAYHKIFEYDKCLETIN